MELPWLYYFDTSSLLDLEEYGLTKRLSKVRSIIVPEVLDEILDRNLRRRLERIATDRGPQKRAAFVPGLDSLDKGERAIIRSMACDRGIGRRVYVSKDAESLEFVGMSSGDISDESIDTSEFIIRLHEYGHVSVDDIRRILSNDSRRPNKKCRERLERVAGPDSQ